jgi:hypothetical protein
MSKKMGLIVVAIVAGCLLAYNKFPQVRKLLGGGA